MAEYDLLVRAGRVFCAESGLDGPGAVAVVGDRIVAAGPEVDGTAEEALDFPNDLLLSGQVDMHAHPARRDSRCRWRCPETAVRMPCCEYTWPMVRRGGDTMGVGFGAGG